LKSSGLPARRGGQPWRLLIFPEPGLPKFKLDLPPKKLHAVVVKEFANCAAVIPCLNESASITALVGGARRRLAAVFVVDDGSADDTARLAAHAGATVLRHEKNFGKGAALQTGLAHAQKSGFEWAVTLDGDGQHAPEDLPALWLLREKTGATLLIGNRMGDAQKMPWLRRSVNRAMSKIISRRAGKNLPDTQSGFRLIHLPTWAALPLHAKRFEVESEMLLAFLAAGERVEFAPVRVRASERGSHIRPLADTLRWLRWWKQFRRAELPRTSVRPVPVKLKPAFIRQNNSTTVLPA
jgi:glycosyltransferase involved in cell wall biosynthesis